MNKQVLRILEIYIAYIHLLTVCQISSYITKNCFKTAMKLHFDCKKALAARALPWTPLGELPLTADPLAYCLALSALGKGLEFFIQEYENNSYRNEKFLFWHPVPIPSTLTCLPHIHPPIIQGSLYSIHLPKPRPPSSTFPINFRIHYLFPAVVHYPSFPHDRTISKHSYLL